MIIAIILGIEYSMMYMPLYQLVIYLRIVYIVEKNTIQHNVFRKSYF